MTLNLDKTAWKRVALGDVVQNLNVTVKDPSAQGIDRVIAMEHLDPGELKVSRWGDLEDGTTFTRRVRPGQTLFGKRRAYQHKAAYADFDAICSGDILVFQTDPEKMLPEFVPFLVQSNSFYEHALGTSAGSLSPRTNWRDLANYEFGLPPLDDQKRIADLFWAIESHLGALRTRSRAMESVMERMLISESMTRASATEWAVVPFPEAIDFREGPGIMARDFRDEGVPLIRLAGLAPNASLLEGCNHLDPNMVDKKWNHFRVEKGDVLLSTSATLGRVAIVDGESVGAVPYTGIIRMRPAEDRIDPEYIPWVLRSADFMQQVRDAGVGSVMAHFGPSHLRKMTVLVPPRAEQERLIGEFRLIENAQETLGTEQADLATLRSTLSQAVFGDPA